MGKKILRDRFINYLPNNIYFLRTKNKMTQQQFGDKLGYSGNTISGWELGIRNPDPFDLLQLSKTLNVSMDDLLKRDLEAEFYDIKRYSKEEVKYLVTQVVKNSSLEEQKKTAIINITELVCTDSEKKEI